MQKSKRQAIANRESFSRINFLYQASRLMAGTNNTLSSFYGELSKKVARRSVLRVSPDMKRWLCKRCSLAQEPGVTATLDVAMAAPTSKKRRRRKQLQSIDEGSTVFLVCRQCGFKRSFEVNSDYHFWLEQPACIAETAKDGNNMMQPPATNNGKTKEEELKENETKKMKEPQGAASGEAK